MILPHLSQHQLLEIAHRVSGEEGTTLLWSGGNFDSACNHFLFFNPIDRIEGENWKRFDLLCQGGMWAGYLSYEMGTERDEFPRTVPGGRFYRYAACLRVGKRTELFIDPTYQGAISLPVGKPIQAQCAPFRLARCSDTRKSYLDKVEAILEHIRAGEVYQACLSHEYWLDGVSDPFDVFFSLVHHSPAPFAAYLHCGDFHVVSLSPERFMRRQGDRVETRPIKGTAPRGKTLWEDEKYRQQLLVSEKERAELTMITDLLRNDLGKVCVPGSVRVAMRAQLEQHATVFHLLSLIEGKLQVGVSSLDVLRAAFPGGSISGCPKIRAMQLIAELEARPRGVYCGAIGYVMGPECCDFNIAIRTLVMFPGQVQMQVGSGIVADSQPELEYEETLHKGKALFRALGLV